MGQTAGSVEFNTFVAGLITEASPLNFPENASLDEENMVLNREGSRQRRLGMDYEANYSFNATNITNGEFQANNIRVSFFRWDNVANDPAISLGVVRIRDRLYLFDLYTSNPSGNQKLGGASFLVGSFSDNIPVSFTTVGGKLIAVDGTSTIHVFEYDSGSDTLTRTGLSPVVRDIWGVDDGLSTDNRPSTLSNAHHYNLHNQGWPEKTLRLDNGSFQDAITTFYNEEGNYPSNADVWYVGSIIDPDNGKLPMFKPGLLDNSWFGTTPAPKGYYLIDPFTRSNSRSSKSGISVNTDITYGGFTAIASYAGRLFASGIRVTGRAGNESTAPRLETFVMFSQVASSDDKLNKFYQEEDPTAQDSAGLLATDGGVITIPEASNIFKLIPSFNSLVVIAENGVWAIYGSDQGFSATDYQVSKISNIGAVNADSVVEAEGRIFYWSKAGIYVLVPDEVTGSLKPQNISETSIQTLYIDIPSVGKAFAKGIYDEAARKVRWIYNDQDDYNGTTYVDHFNKELIFDLTLGAFYKHSIPAGYASPSICDFVSTPNYLSTVQSDNVVQGVNNVVAGTNNVAILTNVRSRGTSTTKYLTIRPGATFAEFTMSEYRDALFRDWKTEDGTGTDAAAYMETGYFTGGDTQRDKQAKYLTVHCKRTETEYSLDGSGNLVFNNPSSCLVQGRWDFSDSANSGKWSDQFQAYRLNNLYMPSGVGDPFDYGYNIITTKNKIRGTGRAIRLKFETEPNKDLYIYGWGLTMSQESDV